jgi:hypothetical protein
MLRKVKLAAFLLAVVWIGILFRSPLTFAATNVQVNVCPAFNAPIVLSPSGNTDTSATRITVSGNSKPGITIKVSDNGRTYPSTIVSSSGKFNSEVPLQIGLNKLTITASNTCGQAHTSNVTAYRSNPSPLSHRILGIICIIELLIIILLIVLLVLCKRRRQHEVKQKAISKSKRKKKQNK